MSVNYYAYAVIGCEVPTNKLYRIVSIEHKEHLWPPGAKFCPTCGKETVVLESESIYDDDNNKLGKFDVVWSTDKERAIIGLGVSRDDYGYGDSTGFMKIPSIETTEAELSSVLNPLGLWDVDKFGLYAVLHCSY